MTEARSSPDRDQPDDKGLFALPDGLPDAYLGEQGRDALFSLLGIRSRSQKQAMVRGAVRYHLKRLYKGSQSGLGLNEKLHWFFSFHSCRLLVVDSYIGAELGQGPSEDGQALYPCFEFLTLQRASPDIWATQLTDEQIDSVLSAPPLAFDHDRRLLDSFPNIAGYLARSLQIFAELLPDIDSFDERDEERQQCIVNCIFSVASLCNDIRVISTAVKRAPSLSLSFDYLLQKHKSLVDAAEMKDDVSPAQPDCHHSWASSFAKLESLAKMAQAGRPSRTLLDQLVAITRDLESTRHTLPKTEWEFFPGSAKTLLVSLTNFLDQCDVVYDKELLLQLLAHWQREANLVTASDGDEASLNSEIDNALKSVESVVQDYRAIQGGMVDLTRHREEIEEQLSKPVAPKQARKLNADRRDIQRQILALEDERFAKHEEIWSAASPPGSPFDLDTDYLKLLAEDYGADSHALVNRLRETVEESLHFEGESTAGDIELEEGPEEGTAQKVQAAKPDAGQADSSVADDVVENLRDRESEASQQAVPEPEVGTLPGTDEGQQLEVDARTEEAEPEPAPELATTETPPADIARAYCEGPAGQRDRHPVNQSNLLWSMVDHGYTLVAHWFLRCLENAGAADSSMPSANIFKAAALAPFVENMHGAAATLHTNAIQDIDTDHHFALLSAEEGDAVRSVSVAATLQPCLFNPMSVSAQILRQSAGHFGRAFSKLLLDIAEYADRGQCISLADLGSSQAAQDYDQELKAIQAKVESIRQLAVSRRTGYYWANIVLKDVLVDSEFASIVRIVRRNLADPSSLTQVRSCIAAYSTRRSLIRLLEDRRTQLQSNSKSSERIVGDARTHFLTQCRDLIDSATLWLELNENQNKANQGFTSEIVRSLTDRLHTVLPNAIADLDIRLASVTRLDEHAGAETLRRALVNLQCLMKGEPTKSFKGIDPETWVNLPNAMMGSPQSEPETPTLADELANFALNGFDYGKWAHYALSDGNIRLANDVAGEIERCGSHDESFLSELHNRISVENDRQRETLRSRLHQLERRIEEAFNASLLPHPLYVEYKFEVEVVQSELRSREDEYPSYVEHNELLQEIEDRIRDITAEHLQNIESDWKMLRSQAEQAERLDDLPAGWEQGLLSAIEAGDVTVAEECIQQFRDFLANNADLFDYKNKGLTALSQFLQHQEAIYNYISSKGIRETAKTIRSGAPVGDIDFGQIADKPTRVFQAIESLRSQPRKTIAEGDLSKLADVLKYCGFQWPSSSRLKNLETIAGDKLLMVKIPVVVGEDDSPIPSFGSKHGKYFPVVLIWKYRNFEEVAQFLQDNNCTTGSVLLFLQPVRIEERTKLASVCHKEHLTLLVLDPVVLLFLSYYRSLRRRETTLRSTFKLCLPFTYDNPYVDALYPPPQEMVFGRRKEIDRLLRPNGAAILYGGRQLGKSTILKEAETRLHNPNESSYAFYFSADSDIAKDLPYESLCNQLWNKIAAKLQAAGLIKNARYKNAEEASNALRELMSRNEALRITTLVDEADNLLNIDSLHDFALFRGFREHFYDSGNRFRIIVAGLQNVQRFSNMPNNPLNQLGGSQPVTILPSVDGIRLVRDPLAVLGFTFDEMTTVNRILAYANNHPGLIQLFCHYLVDHLNNQICRGRIKMPGYEITEKDIEQTYQTKAIREGIVDRFNLTLRLDPRYRVLAYGFILDNIKLNYFNVKEAKDIGDRYWPEEFRGMSTTKLRAILEEMVGLGVLIHETGEQSEDLYRFRNTNVFQLLGSEDIKRETIKEITEHISEEDPMVHHRLILAPEKDKKTPELVYSPLTVGDELELLGKLDARQVDDEDGNRRSTDIDGAQITIASVYGSMANGLGYVKRTLPWLSTLNDPESQKEYQLVSMGADKATSVVAIQQYVERILEIAVERPVILTLEMPAFSDDPSLYMEFLEYLYAIRRKRPKHRVWIVLLFGPAATWAWLGNRNVADVEADGIHIPLERWRNPGLDRVLKDLHMLDGKKQIQFVSEKTGGWYGFVKLFADKARESGKIDDPEKLSSFINIVSDRVSHERTARHALQDIGIDSIDHMNDLLAAIVANGFEKEMQLDSLRLITEEYSDWGFDGEEKRTLEWLIRVGILRAIDTVDGKDRSDSEMCYEIEPITLRLLNAASDGAAGASNGLGDDSS